MQRTSKTRRKDNDTFSEQGKQPKKSHCTSVCVHEPQQMPPEAVDAKLAENGDGQSVARTCHDLLETLSLERTL